MAVKKKGKEKSCILYQWRFLTSLLLRKTLVIVTVGTVEVRLIFRAVSVRTHITSLRVNVITVMMVLVLLAMIKLTDQQPQW